eukprot:CAMPEP_0185253220 /NCGR_PEP_ID=MMETSP1359-20130426/2062_1 /TAXON_ID=552665 /ORGANISM="Bigelowiella longifila, Strain CCMP242" /LENGTH=96 /DNA_ID=CAMNT_0027835563 /DNA_START=343 /DNA_END=629 /DNA_ORIENTATION=+
MFREEAGIFSTGSGGGGIGGGGGGGGDDDGYGAGAAPENVANNDVSVKNDGDYENDDNGYGEGAHGSSEAVGLGGNNAILALKLGGLGLPEDILLP